MITRDELDQALDDLELVHQHLFAMIFERLARHDLVALDGVISQLEEAALEEQLPTRTRKLFAKYQVMIQGVADGGGPPPLTIIRGGKSET